MCGIFGIISSKPKKFDLQTFCVLGVNNDSRGGDSCGVFIDGKYEYGVNEFKLFYNFFPKSKLLNSTNKCKIALGHCRKASVGAINEANAQPIVIKDQYGKVQYVLMHNGTIVNYKELATKYIPNINIEHMTDSQVMAYIFYNTGYKVLGEYIGAGAFVIVDYRKEEPEVLFFKGESKTNEYSTTTTIERPLFCTYNDEEFIFSSIMDYLKALRQKREVLTIKSNTLLQLENGKLYIKEEYDRTDKYQSKPYSSIYNVVNGSRVSNCCKKDSEDIWLPSDFGRGYWDDVIDMDKNGVYRTGSERAHGVYWVDVIGNIEKTKVPGTIQAAFWKGVLLKNPSCYEFLYKFSKEMNCSHDELFMTLPDLVHYLSPCPCWKTHRGQWVTSDTPASHFLYTGTVVFPFTTEQLYISSGSINNYTEGIPYRDALLSLQESANYKIDHNAIEQLL